jgi:hypothetical protein
LDYIDYLYLGDVMSSDDVFSARDALNVLQSMKRMQDDTLPKLIPYNHLFPQCLFCKFWKRGLKQLENPTDMELNRLGQCRRHAPTASVVGNLDMEQRDHSLSLFPITKDVHWCGEFERGFHVRHIKAKDDFDHRMREEE